MKPRIMFSLGLVGFLGNGWFLYTDHFMPLVTFIGFICGLLAMGGAVSRHLKSEGWQ